VAEILFFQLSAVIESNVPQAYVGRYVGRSGWWVVVVGCSTSVYMERCGSSTIDVASFPASSE